MRSTAFLQVRITNRDIGDPEKVYKAGHMKLGTIPVSNRDDSTELSSNEIETIHFTLSLRTASRMTDLAKTVASLLASGPHKVETSPRRVRILYNGVFIADDLAPRYVWEHPYYPHYYVHNEKVKSGVLSKKKAVDSDNSAYLASLKVNDRSTDRVVVYEKGPLAGLVKFEFGAMDAWFEEDEKVFCHPKDPYKRVDILPSSRHIEVKIDGHTVAESRAPLLLFETSLKTRYYLPITSLVDISSIKESQTSTVCPYKGVASYYDIVVNGKTYKDIIWYYTTPTLESIQVAGKICFYNEKVEIWIDGVKEQLK